METDLTSYPPTSSNSAEFWENVKQSAAGLLPLQVYAALYKVGYESQGGTFVEIGTAHGAATIALARGALDASKRFHIYTVDPFQGRYSSRTAYGNVEENTKLVQSQFSKFGVSNYITLVSGTCETLLQECSIGNINLLLLDADGSIDRDLSLLAGRLASNCKVIIDDLDDVVYLVERDGFRLVDQKHRISYLLAQNFVANGFLRPLSKIEATGFFEKGPIEWTSDSMLRSSLPLYRALVFAELPLQPIESPWSGVAEDTKSWLHKNTPPLFFALRGAKRLALAATRFSGE